MAESWFQNFYYLCFYVLVCRYFWGRILCWSKVQADFGSKVARSLFTILVRFLKLRVQNVELELLALLLIHYFWFNETSQIYSPQKHTGFWWNFGFCLKNPKKSKVDHNFWLFRLFPQNFWLEFIIRKKLGAALYGGQRKTMKLWLFLFLLTNIGYGMSNILWVPVKIFRNII